MTPPNGYLRRWGRTKVDHLDSIRGYLGDERFGGRDCLALDLGELLHDRCDEMYGVFRRRPLTLRCNLQERMKPSTAKNLIKELGNFFDWLDGPRVTSGPSPGGTRSSGMTIRPGALI